MIIEEKKKTLKKKAQVLKNECVACGTCQKICPINSIKIVAGVYAEVDPNRCVGCSKCEKICPASVIEMISKEVVN